MNSPLAGSREASAVNSFSTGTPPPLATVALSSATLVEEQDERVAELEASLRALHKEEELWHRVWDLPPACPGGLPLADQAPATWEIHGIR